MEVNIPVGSLIPAQSVKLEGAIAAQIVSVMGEANEMLLEYVMVMLNNGKDIKAVATDLEDLIGGSQAQDFASWLGTYISEHVINSSTEEVLESDALHVEVDEEVVGEDDPADSPTVESSSPVVHVGNEARIRKGGLFMSALNQAGKSGLSTNSKQGRTNRHVLGAKLTLSEKLDLPLGKRLYKKTQARRRADTRVITTDAKSSNLVFTVKNVTVPTNAGSAPSHLMTLFLNFNKIVCSC